MVGFVGATAVDHINARSRSRADADASTIRKETGNRVGKRQNAVAEIQVRLTLCMRRESARSKLSVSYKRLCVTEGRVKLDNALCRQRQGLGPVPEVFSDRGVEIEMDGETETEMKNGLRCVSSWIQRVYRVISRATNSMASRLCMREAAFVDECC